MLQMIDLPVDLMAVAIFRLEGDDVQVNYRPVEGVIQPPRRQLAKALRMLAEHFEAEADQTEMEPPDSSAAR